MYKPTFKRHLEDIDLDARSSNSNRFFDQKATPDVVSSIASVVLVTARDTKAFNNKDIRESREFQRIADEVFVKPKLEQAPREYDKFVNQPMQVLRCAGVLDGIRKGNSWHYRIRKRDILKKVAESEMSAIDFLVVYLDKFLLDSGLSAPFRRFFKQQNKDSLANCVDSFKDMMQQHMNTNNPTEPARICNKVINILAYDRCFKGRIGGHLSKGRITLEDIRYNRINWRDTKPKNQPRTAAQPRDYSNISLVRKVIQDVKKFHRNAPEINREFSDILLDTVQAHTVQAHHIFPHSDFPQLADVRENIILLTPSQHYSMAHPKGKTQKISLPFQLGYLLKKLETIVRCELRDDCNFYSLETFFKVLSQGAIINNEQLEKFIHHLKSPVSGQKKKLLLQGIHDSIMFLLLHHYH